MAGKRKIEIDAGLLEELRCRAEEQGRSETEVLEAAVSRYRALTTRRSGSFREVLR